MSISCRQRLPRIAECSRLDMTSGGRLIQPLAESGAGFKGGPWCSGLGRAGFGDLHGWRINRLSGPPVPGLDDSDCEGLFFFYLIENFPATTCERRVLSFPFALPRRRWLCPLCSRLRTAGGSGSPWVQCSCLSSRTLSISLSSSIIISSRLRALVALL